MMVTVITSAYLPLRALPRSAATGLEWKNLTALSEADKFRAIYREYRAQPTIPFPLQAYSPPAVSVAAGMSWLNKSTLGHPLFPKKHIQPLPPPPLRAVTGITIPAVTAPSRFAIELRDKSFNLKGRLEAYVDTIQWEWNRIGGCGRCTMVVQGDYLRFSVAADDDVRVYLPNATTGATLWYRGYVTSTAPTLSTGDAGNIRIECTGYFGWLDRIVVHDDNDVKEYENQELSQTVSDIISDFVVPNSSITLGTINASDFSPDILSFKVTAKDAIGTCFDLISDVEYGVNAQLEFYWYNRISTVLTKFYLGGNVTKLSDLVDFRGMMNSIYFEGGDSSGSPFRASGGSSDSQTKFGLREALVSNGSITTNSVAQQYISSLLSQFNTPQRQMSVSLKNIATRFEASLPIGTVSIVDQDSAQSLNKWGKTASGGSNLIYGTAQNLGSGRLWGGVRKEQIDRIVYTLSPEDGRIHADVQFGSSVAFSRASATLKRIEQIQNTLQQRSR